MLQESTKLIATSLLNYTKLPTSRRAICDSKSGDFMFHMTSRAGCPLSEKELHRQLLRTVYTASSQINLNVEKKKAVINNAKYGKVMEAASSLSYLIALTK